MLKKITIGILILTIPFLLSAQRQYSTTHKKAIKAYNEALHSLNYSVNIKSAIDLLNKAIKYDEDFIEAHLVLAELYYESGNRKNAIQEYKNTIKISPDFFSGMYIALAQLLMEESKYDEAGEHIKQYLTFKNIKPEAVTDAKKMLESCEFAVEAMNNPVPFNPLSLGDSINTEYDEYWPGLTADEKTLVITRLIPKSIDTTLEQNKYTHQNLVNDNKNKTSGLKEVHEDFFVSKKINGNWNKALNAGEPLNTPGNEGAQTITVDGQVMFFTACNRKDGKGRCDIYMSVLENQKWSKPVNIGAPVNTSAWEAQPSISADGKTIYFVSNSPGGLGGKDIWLSRQKKDKTWTKPQNLGEKINTRGQEQSPFIHPDNKTLYFASDGRIGMGQFDLYKATLNDDESWSEPMNLGYPINTAFNEIGLIVNTKGNKAYFSSDRFSDKGRDIFEFDLYKEARPEEVSYIKGKVFDADTKNNLKAYFELIDLDKKEVTMSSESNPKTGEFLLCIPTNKDYALNVSKENYLFYSDNFSLKGIYEIDNPFLKDIPLKPIKIGETIILKNIFFATDSYELMEKSETELLKLVNFLSQNQNLKIEISGHTDNTGSDLYNIELSENRAKSVYNYLILKQIKPERLSYKGYGENKPISNNDTEKGKAQNRRTEITIIN